MILRTDGTPTYHLASTVDDVDYEITHVARGEDLLPVDPEAHPPHQGPRRRRAHAMPTSRCCSAPTARSCPSASAPISLSTYRDEGYLPDAVFNYLSLLGWSLDGRPTIFTRDEAIAAFDLNDVSSNPAIFDPDKLAWMNGEYIRATATLSSSRDLAGPTSRQQSGAPSMPEEWARFEAVADLVQERTRLLPEAGEQVVFLFEDFDEYDRAAWEKVMAKDGVAEILDDASERLASVDDWAAGDIEAVLREMLEELGIGAAKGLQPLRVAVTGSSVSPPLFESLAALGKETDAGRRLEQAQRELARLGVGPCHPLTCHRPARSRRPVA